MFNSLISNSSRDFTISSKTFTQWMCEYSFNALRTGQSLGQSFCDCHNVQDNLLMFTLDNEQSVGYIKKTYVK